MKDDFRYTVLTDIKRDTVCKGNVYLFRTGSINPEDVVCGKPDFQWGKAAFTAVECAVREAQSGKIDAIVTAPVCKEALDMAGYTFLGHTEFLAFLTKTTSYRMMFVGGGLRVILATIHVPLKKIFSLLDEKTICETVQHAHRATRLLGVEKPTIAVCGLNPHAGENSVLGTEERDIVTPAILKARSQGIDVLGPLPSDTVFYRAQNNEFDCVVALYHDQGLIPFKMIAFDEGVNLTVGLPFIRTSPDHGTAFSIAGKGIADPRSITEAIKLAVHMFDRKGVRNNNIPNLEAQI